MEVFRLFNEFMCSILCMLGAKTDTQNIKEERFPLMLQKIPRQSPNPETVQKILRIQNTARSMTNKLSNGRNSIQ
eukprot:6486371-Amphidinium_carterae.1